MGYKMKGFSGFKKHPTKAIKEVNKTKAAKNKGSEREIYLAKLRGDYVDLTGDKLRKASKGDPTGTVVSKYPKGPITGN